MAENAPNNAPDIVFEEDEISAGVGDDPVDAEETETEKVVVEVPETTAWGVIWRGMTKAQSLKAEDAAAATTNAIERNAKPEGWVGGLGRVPRRHALRRGLSRLARLAAGF